MSFIIVAALVATPALANDKEKNKKNMTIMKLLRL